MKFQRYQNFVELAPLKDAWNHLLNQSASDVPFLTFEYLQAWWSTRGGGEWPDDAQLVIITAMEENQLVGIAPLFFAENLQGKPALMFVGAIEVSDFLDFIVKPEDLRRFLNGLLAYLLNETSLPHWEVLDLYNLLEDSPTLSVLQAEASARGWAYIKTCLQPAPYVPLTSNYDTYLMNLDKKQRHEIRRKWRNVENSLAEPGFYTVQEARLLPAETQDFIAMMAQDPNKRAFLTPAMRRHLEITAQTAFDAGWLHLSFFTLDGSKAAGHFSFLYQNRLWLYNSGWEWDFRDYSPGWVHLAHLMGWAIEKGLSEVDFMRGDENYKYKFGGVDRHVYRLTLERGK
jgi:CelD/BcsL family acetyltransferase involved in cellulose biosynthesis